MGFLFAGLGDSFSMLLKSSSGPGSGSRGGQGSQARSTGWEGTSASLSHPLPDRSGLDPLPSLLQHGSATLWCADRLSLHEHREQGAVASASHEKMTDRRNPPSVGLESPGQRRVNTRPN